MKLFIKFAIIAITSGILTDDDILCTCIIFICKYLIAIDMLIFC